MYIYVYIHVEQPFGNVVAHPLVVCMKLDNKRVLKTGPVENMVYSTLVAALLCTFPCARAAKECYYVAHNDQETNRIIRATVQSIHIITL